MNGQIRMWSLRRNERLPRAHHHMAAVALAAQLVLAAAATGDVTVAIAAAAAHATTAAALPLAQLSAEGKRDARRSIQMALENVTGAFRVKADTWCGFRLGIELELRGLIWDFLQLYAYCEVCS